MIVFFSKSNNTQRLVNNLSHESVSIFDYNGVDKYVLITPTYFFGEVPVEVQDFLKQHSHKMIGVIACGNKNWGEYFGKAGDIISQQYNVPLLYKVELSGNKKDIQNIENILRKEDSFD